MEQDHNSPSTELPQPLHVTPSMSATLLSANRWMQFFIIISCVSIGLLMVAGLVMIIIGSFLPVADVTDGSSLPLLGLGVLYLVLGAAYVYPLVRGFRMVDHTRRALQLISQNDFEQAASDFYAMLRYCGYLMIAILGIYALAMCIFMGIAIMH